jgi:hypothetical protein
VGTETPSYRGFRFPAEIISHCVWLYHRFPLSFRDVEEMMLQRGVTVSHQTVRQWCRTFGQTYPNQTHRDPASPEKFRSRTPAQWSNTPVCAPATTAAASIRAKAPSPVAADPRCG